ncbi:uncharacterized protein LODBEIA_P57040 [Lodderomyces beijingensis]|uniref:Arginine N-methyltransferase 2 n=1 Tax=Lodderomyces beijingensis TaxID=1775926 RepID=A0ABP0ZVP7_9ASCO
MSQLHDLCKFPTRPITVEYVSQLRSYLSSGVPATYTVEEAYNYENRVETEPATATTPLHLICTHVPTDLDEGETAVVDEMCDVLFEYGAGWSFTDVNNETPGCVLIRRGLKDWALYEKLVDAGVRAELLLRKVSEYDVEFVEEGEVVASEEAAAPSHNQQAFLESKLEYVDDALVTKERKDGVMMSWESDIMQLAADSITVNGSDDLCILNIGFGMGIIDTMLQQKNPRKHYICEAHPDVLAKMKQDGWFEKANVVVLSGRWQDELDKLLSQGTVFFDGIYYDTFSEHYSDMLELFDYVVGLLKPDGVFSFFNGLGADRQVIYEVYKKLVQIDLENYGLRCRFKEMRVPPELFKKGGESIWDDIKRSYWSCPIYYHPEATFMDFS